MPTQCNQEFLEFHPLDKRQVRGQFEGGTITSDAGGRRREVAKRTGIGAQTWPDVKITIRGASGFCRAELLAGGERHRVDDGLGLAKNERRKAAIAPEREPAARVFKDVVDQTRESWARARRVVGKAEHLEKGSNPRFVVTSLPRQAWAAQAWDEERYCARGEMENRSKEQWLRFSDRTSTAYLRSKQIRWCFSSVAYRLLQALRRRGWQGTGQGAGHDATAEAVEERGAAADLGAESVGITGGR